MYGSLRRLEKEAASAASVSSELCLIKKGRIQRSGLFITLATAQAPNA